jgi:hypothetical protein
MTIDRMDVQELIEKAPDADFLREMIAVISNRLMEMELESLTRVDLAHQPPQRLSRAHLGDARLQRRPRHPEAQNRPISSARRSTTRWTPFSTSR